LPAEGRTGSEPDIGHNLHVDNNLCIAVVGSSATSPDVLTVAEQLGAAIARRGASLVCGGLGGVMEAACKGAHSAGGLTIGILPGLEHSEANSHVDVPIPTGMGEMRNALVVRTSHAVIAVAGEYGTLSEIAFALRTGVPVIGIDTWELGRGGEQVDAIRRAKDPEEAVAMAIEAAGR
jgi:uncharacterized protein (TIGR00725 family)